MAEETGGSNETNLLLAEILKSLTTKSKERTSSPGKDPAKGSLQNYVEALQNETKDAVKNFMYIKDTMKTMFTDIGKAFKDIDAKNAGNTLMGGNKAKFEKSMLAVGILAGAIGSGAKLAAAGFSKGLGGAMDQANKIMSSTSVEGAMKGVKDASFKAMETIGVGGGPIASALSVILDTFIQGIMFRFEDDLKGRERTRAITMQLGADPQQTEEFATEMNNLVGKVGRAAATEWTEGFAGIGVIEADVANKMIGLAYNMKMGSGEATKLLEKYKTFGNDSSQAVKKLDENFRKLQAAARESGLPVKMMADYIAQASTNARFLNVDVAMVGNTMANLQKSTKDLSNLGVDFRQHGATIMSELASGGKSISDSMHVFYGSKGGMQNMSVGAAWAKSMFGDKTGGITKTATGGFTTGSGEFGGASQGNTMMIQRLTVLKDLMQNAAATAEDSETALMLQMKVAKEIGGMSDATAITLAKQGADDIAKLADDPEMATAMDDTNTILGKMQSSAVKSENLQRHLVNLNMAIVKILFEIPILIIGWFDKSNLFGSGSDTLYKNSLAALSKQGGEFKQAAVGAGKVLGSMAANDMNYFGGRIDTAVRAMKGGGGGGFSEGILKEEVEADTKRNFMFYLTDEARARIAAGEAAKKAAKKAEGGPVSAGSLYSVGEGNKPELLMIPGNRGEVLSSDKVDKLASAGATGSGSGGGVTINLSVHGVTKDQIINQLTNEILKVLQ